MLLVEPYNRFALSNNTDLLCFQFNLLFLMRTLLQNSRDFSSAAKCEQPQVEEKGKSANQSLFFTSVIHAKG